MTAHLHHPTSRGNLTHTEHTFPEGTYFSDCTTPRPHSRADAPRPSISSHTHPRVLKSADGGKPCPQCLGGARVQYKTPSRNGSWLLLPIIHTILFLALSLSSFKNSPRVNSSNCFLTERKAQPDECFLCSSLEKSTQDHVN